jgi:hypothetical protein
MSKPVALSALAGTEFVPQAIINWPISRFAEQLHVLVNREHDDFDEYEAVAILTDGGVPVTLKHYAGYPPNTTTIYLPNSFTSLVQISELIATVVGELDVPRSSIVWQRANNPEL